MAEIGRAELTILPVFAGGQRALEKQLSTGGSGGGFTAAGKKAGGAFAGGLRSIVGPAAAVLGGAAAIDFAQSAVTQASDVGESINALSVVYGDATDAIVKMGEAAASERGLSALDFNNLTVQFSAFAKTVAGDGGDVIGTIDDLTMRATDFASVMNLEVSEAAQIFQSSLAGETEPIRRFGIDLSAAAVEAYAYANGITESGEALTEAEKVQARYGLLMEQTNQTAGDFANTSDSLANQQRILAAEWENMQAQLGEALLPVMQDVTGWLLEDGLPGLKGFVNDLGDPSTTIGGFVEDLSGIWDNAQPVLDAAWDFGTEMGGALLEGLNNYLTAYQEGGWVGVGEFLEEWSYANRDKNALAEGINVLNDTMALAMGNEPSWDRARREAEELARATRGTNGNLGPTLPSGVNNWQPYSAPLHYAYQPAITANPNAGNTIVNIQSATFQDTAEAARLAEREKRTAAVSGSRPINRGMR